MSPAFPRCIVYERKQEPLLRRNVTSNAWPGTEGRSMRKKRGSDVKWERKEKGIVAWWRWKKERRWRNEEEEEAEVMCGVVFQVQIVNGHDATSAAAIPPTALSLALRGSRGGVGWQIFLRWLLSNCWVLFVANFSIIIMKSQYSLRVTGFLPAALRSVLTWLPFTHVNVCVCNYMCPVQRSTGSDGTVC